MLEIEETCETRKLPPHPARQVQGDLVELVASIDEWGNFPVKDFWQFAYEREAIRRRRFDLGQSGPWTKDPVMRERFFTNCFREDDPGTAIAVEIMEPIDSAASDRVRSDAERLWNLLLYRRFNREDTWRDAIGYLEWNDSFDDRARTMFRRLEKREAARKPLFTDAHQVYPLVQLADVDPKLLKRVIAASWRHDMPASTELAEKLRASADMKDAFKTVKNAKLPGIAGFLAWQLCLDLRYGEDPILVHSDDEWAPVQAGCRVGCILYANWPAAGVVAGGGAARGPNGEWQGSGAPPPIGPDGEPMHVLKSIPPKECEAIMRGMRDGQDEEFAARGLDFLGVSGGRRMTIASLEHALCEAQKYWGIARGMPHSKRAFKG